MKKPLATTMISNANRAFTLIELLVATSITVLLLTIIGSVMQTTSQAVELTVANQDVSAYAAGFSSTLRDDFKRLRRDTFMVIRNQSEKPFSTLPVTSGDYTKDRYNLDQIMFFADGPWTSQRYDSATLSRTVQADLARVWYGHVAANNNLSLGVGVSYSPCYDLSGELLKQVDWSLGRHVLLLPNIPNSGSALGAPV